MFFAIAFPTAKRNPLRESAGDRPEINRGFRITRVSRDISEKFDKCYYPSGTRHLHRSCVSFSSVRIDLRLLLLYDWKVAGYLL